MGVVKTLGHRRKYGHGWEFPDPHHARESSSGRRPESGGGARCLRSESSRAIAREKAGWRYLGALAGPFYQPGCVVGRW
jgi:hypothetical protein